MLMAPHEQPVPGGTLEVSVHMLGPLGRSKATAAIDGAPSGGELLAVSTFQFAAPGTKRAVQANAFVDPPTPAQVY